MNDVAQLVDQDVAIVTVLDLQEVRDDSVRSHTPHEVVASLLELLATSVSVLGEEVLVQSLLFLTQLVPRDRIRHNLDDSTLRRKLGLT